MYFGVKMTLNTWYHTHPTWPATIGNVLDVGEKKQINLLPLFLKIFKSYYLSNKTKIDEYLMLKCVIGLKAD